MNCQQTPAAIRLSKLLCAAELKLNSITLRAINTKAGTTTSSSFPIILKKKKHSKHKCMNGYVCLINNHKDLIKEMGHKNTSLKEKHQRCESLPK